MNTQFDIIIIGAGFSGLCMAIGLKKAGYKNFIILERAAKIGGTWRDNTYPGAACDVSSHMYSFSFEPNPNWSEMFSGQAEILKYMEHCVQKYELQNFIHFNTKLLDAQFNETLKTWQVGTQNHKNYTCQSLIMGSGPLNRPNFPNLQGMNSFEGEAFHTMHWNHNYNLEGKKVGIIGTGASAIQVIPEIAPKCEQLLVFQRTAPWVLPKLNRKMSNFEHKMFQILPFTQKIYRLGVYCLNEFYGLAITKNSNFILKTIEKSSLKYINTKVKPTIREKVKPTYRIGCKRILLSKSYYPALNRDNVHVETNSIEAIEPQGIKTKDGRLHPVDCIIYATGYQASEYPEEYKIYGKNKMELKTAWQKGPQAYLGMVVTNFPNLFLLVGPNTGLGHNSIIYMIEAQVNYIIQLLGEQKKQASKSLNVKPEIQEKYNQSIQEKLKNTVWASGCSSWYITKEGINTTLFPGFTFQYKKIIKKLKKQDFDWE